MGALTSATPGIPRVRYGPKEEKGAFGIHY